jgi:hypothetical protein
MTSTESSRRANFGERIIKNYISQILQIPTQEKGIDFLDEEVGLELKVKKATNKSTWTVHDYQPTEYLKKHPQHQLFWCFAKYHLKPEEGEESKEVKKADLEARLDHIEVWLLPWEWVNKKNCTKGKKCETTMHKTKGEGYLYAHETKVAAETYHTIKVGKDIFHIPLNSMLYDRYYELPKVHSMLVQYNLDQFT